MLKTPVLFLIFNRPEETNRVFEEIKKQKPQYLYIAADGPRSNKPGEAEKCQETRSVTEKIDWDCEVKTLFREENLGCKKAVSEGITWFFDNEEEGIIIEDDCLPSESFFKFCVENLDKYRHDVRVMHVSGENPLDHEVNNVSYYFSKIPHIWGWASWRRAWNFYDVTMQNLDYDAIKNVFEQKEAQEYWNKIFIRVKNGEIDTWDYQWTYALFVNDGLSIVPNKNMVSNIGFGHENAAHTSENADCANRQAFEIEDIKHPELIEPDMAAVNEVLKVRYDIHKKTLPFIIKRELSRIFRKLNAR